MLTPYKYYALAMKPYFKYIVSISLLALGLNAKAQDSLQVQVKESVQISIADTLSTQNADTLKTAETDSLVTAKIDSSQFEQQKRYFSLLVGTDYGKLITTVAGFETKYEFNLGIQFSKHIRATADYGYGSLAPPNAIENGTYTSSGSYYRVGLDYMFNIAPEIYLSLGGMYASSSFKDEGTVEITSEVWPSLKESFIRDDLTATWAEFVLTSEATLLNRDSGIFDHLYWGIKFRLRFSIDRSQPENFDVYAIPGYGRTWNNLVPAANLFVAYKF